MRRYLVVMLAYLLLGAVVNVAVAWGATIALDGYALDEQKTEQTMQGDIALWRERMGSLKRQTNLVLEGSGLGVDARLLVSDTYTMPVQTLVQVRAGLPLRCLVGDRWWEPLGSGGNLYRDRFALGFERVGLIRVGGTEHGFLPLRPLFPAFALNTLLYATLLWLLNPGPFVLRRFLRLRRGLCPKCAYPMGEAAVCTECGKALPKHAVG